MEHEDVRATRTVMGKLPEYCFTYHPVSQMAVKLQRGVTGYVKLDTLADPEKLNASLGVTKAQAEAMLAGSLFGWHTRAADPAAYDENGGPLSAGRSRRRSRGDRCSACGEVICGGQSGHVCRMK